MQGVKRAWEYLHLDVSEAGQPDLSALGNHGWELVSAANGLVLKRPVPEFRERVTLDQKRAVYERFDLPWPPASERENGG